MLDKHSISIWVFIGSLLAVYGGLILGNGLYTTAMHRRAAVVLASLHIDIWWGAGLLLLGGFYVIRFWPKANKAPRENDPPAARTR